jgi:hypothetical protein
MKSALICLIALFLAADALMAGQIELTLQPAKVPEPKHKYQLLPEDSECSDSDAVPLYTEAVQSIPKDFQKDQINQWIHEPLNKLPQEQAQAMLLQFKSTLELVQKAAKCKQCNWPDIESGEMPGNLGDYRHIADVLTLQVRLQIAQGKYDRAIDTFQTGFAMSRHLAEDSTLIQGLVGIAIGGRMCRQIEDFIQTPEAPNLYWALRNLPKPFIDLTEQIELEMPEVREKIRLLMNRLDRHIATLQCIEALRLYAAAHNGKFPSNLGEITEVTIPDDPVTNKPFIYRRTTGSQAILEGPIPEGGTDKDSIHYELKLKE